MTSSRIETREAASYASAGFTYAGTMLVFGGVGYLVDRWAGTDPWLLVLGLIAGAVGGFIRLVITFSTKSRARGDDGRAPGKDSGSGG
jgi:F0F1-type ATP synthase assembly protein I